MGKILSIIVILSFAVVAGFPLLHKGLLPTHDGEYHLVRFFLFNEALRDGNAYPRWAEHLNNNFGVPLFTFVYPFPNYISNFFHLLNFSFIDSFKLSLFLATIIGCIFFYLWAKEFWGKLGGIVSSVFYTFSPYHFVDIYVRGSVGEVWALAFFPAFLWAYTKLVITKQKIFLVFSSIFLSLVIFSHNILALMFFLFVISYIIFLVFKERHKNLLIKNSIIMIILGLGMSAIFWIPAIFETKYVTGLQIFDVSAHFPDLYQLLIPSWGSGFSGTGLKNTLSFQIGIANIFVVFLSLIVIVWQIVKRKNNGYSIFFLVWLIVVFYLMLSVSLPFWKMVPFMNYFQFPWRFLSLEILFASFLAGSIFSLKIKTKLINFSLAIFLVFIAFFLGIGYTKPAYYLYREDSYYFTRSNFMDGTNSPGNVFNTIFLKNIPDKESERAVFLNGEGKIILNKAKNGFYEFKINAKNSSEILVNIAYYPGWNVYINNIRIGIKQREGRFTFLVSSGESKVEVIFEETKLRMIASLISILSIIYLLTLFMMGKSSKID